MHTESSLSEGGREGVSKGVSEKEGGQERKAEIAREITGQRAECGGWSAWRCRKINWEIKCINITALFTTQQHLKAKNTHETLLS